MRQYEADTWYDTNGRIVFTPSKGLPGVGLPRKAVKGDTSYTLRIPDPDTDRIPDPGSRHASSGTPGAVHNGQEAAPATVQTGITLGCRATAYKITVPSVRYLGSHRSTLPGYASS